MSAVSNPDAARDALGLPRMTIQQMSDRVYDVVLRSSAVRDGALVRHSVVLEWAEIDELGGIKLFLDGLIPLQRQIAELRRGVRP